MIEGPGKKEKGVKNRKGVRKGSGQKGVKYHIDSLYVQPFSTEGKGVTRKKKGVKYHIDPLSVQPFSTGFYLGPADLLAF